jgi:thiol-disulfide isomerase/thioredoxin
MNRAVPIAVALAMLAAVLAAVLLQFASPRDESARGGRMQSATAPLPAQRAEPPRPLPQLQFIDATSRPRPLTDFRGRAVLLNLWATWCVPCREEMPALDRLQAALGGPVRLLAARAVSRPRENRMKRGGSERLAAHSPMPRWR